MDKIESSIHIKRISMSDPLYQFERELRNTVLLRPIGLPDYGWEMKDNSSWHFVALDNEKLVGCVVLAPLDKEGHTTQLMQMAVATSEQGKGIGRLLVEELLGFARLQGIKEVMCHSRLYANEFYQKLGFEIYGEVFYEADVAHNNMKIVIN